MTLKDLLKKKDKIKEEGAAETRVLLLPRMTAVSALSVLSLSLSSQSQLSVWPKR